ncbi:MAG: biotin/lipoyl-binding protein [Gemmataceae bacterium]|nr:biotin/lipoyl-binding protein [Gemmataceae bacterium]
MTRGRIFTFLAILGLSTAVLTVLMTSRAAGDKPADPKSAGDRERKLVCWGEVDTHDRFVGLFPENFPMPARVTKVLRQEGAEVKKGEPLLEFDTEQLNLKVREADNGIQIAMGEQTKAEGAVRTHTVLVNEADKLWQAKQAILASKQSELKEAERLFKIKIGNQLTLEAAQAAMREAELNSEAAKIKLDGLRVEVPNYYVDIARENVKHKQTLKAQAEQARDLLSCKAPADGKIIRSFVTEGANYGMQSREPAFWFLKKGPLIVRAEVTQEFAKGVSVGKSAIITDDSDESQVWTGAVTKVGEQFLPKRHGGASILDLMPVSDERVLECHVSIDVEPGKPAPKFGQKVRVALR